MAGRRLPFWQTITARLNFAVGVMILVLLATGIHTVMYLDAVAKRADTLTAQRIAALSDAGSVQLLLVRHRALTIGILVRGPDGLTDVRAGLAGVEQRWAALPALSGGIGAPSSGLVQELKEDATHLTTLSREVLNGVAAHEDKATLSARVDKYMTRSTLGEWHVFTWRSQIIERTSTLLAEMSVRATTMRRICLVTIGISCLIGVIVMLACHRMLARLRRLTDAMLALAGGDLAVDVPFLGTRDEIGLLADALDVFRGQTKGIAVNEANLSTVIENMSETIVMFSAKRAVVLHNQNFVRSLNLAQNDCAGMSAGELMQILMTRRGWPLSAVQKLEDRIASVRRQGGSDSFDIALPGDRAWTLTAVLLPNDNLLVCGTDMTERRASAARIYHLAHHDVLTDLPNRALFHERLEEAMQRAAAEPGLCVTLLLCDLDRFKEVNDTYGHPTGDALLQAVAQRMRGMMRQSDILARLGGDEFAIVHLSDGDPHVAQALAGRIVAALEQPFSLQGNQVRIGVSIGIASAPVDALDAVELTKCADIALYAVKEGGRGAFAVYDHTMAAKREERLVFEADMRAALAAGQFHLNYQPQVDLRTRRIVGFEALARWTHADHGVIPSAVFIPAAEETGLIIELGEWVLRTACADAANWGGTTTVAVNVAVHQFRDKTFVDTVRSALQDSGLPPHRLELEVTESSMLQDGQEILAVLHTLRGMGVRIAMDDFGTGYSALRYLQMLPFDKIKIDRSFVRDFGSTMQSDAIVRAAASLSGRLGIRTVVEGVETEAQAEIVLDAACDEAQGYLFGRPVHVADVADLLREADIAAAGTGSGEAMTAERSLADS